MLISDENLQRFVKRAGEEAKKQANEILEHGKIVIEKFQLGWNYEYIYVYAKVTEGIFNRQVAVNFSIDISNQEIDTHHCQCNYYSARICPHTIACVLKFCREDRYEKQAIDAIKKQKREEEHEKFHNFISNFEEVEEPFVNDANMDIDYLPNGTIKLIPELKYDGYPLGLMLYFKIGEKQLYRIKDLLRFYDAYLKRENLYYGSKLSFIHCEDAFSSKAKAFLDYILKYAETIQYANNILKENKYYYTKGQISKAGIELVGSAADDFFNIFNEEEEYAIEYNKEKISFKLTNKKPDIKFKIEKKEEDEYKLSANFTKLLIVKGIKFVYILKDNLIYKLDRYKNSNLIKMIELYNKSDVDEYRFDKRYLLEFINKVLPKVKEIVNVDEMPETEVELYIPKKLRVKILLDTDSEDNILLTPKFCYGEMEFNPLDEENIPKIPRDFYKEDEVFRRIKQDGFYSFKEDKAFVMHEEERIYNFLVNSLNEYMGKFEVLVTDEFKKNEIKQPKIASVGVRIQNDLLNIDLSSMEFDKQELKEILNKYKLKKKYHRLKDGSFLSLENNKDLEFLGGLTDGMAIEFKSIIDGSIKLPINRSLYLNKLLSKLPNAKILEDDEFEKLVKESNKGENIEIPKQQENILREYQKTGYRWLKTLDKYKFGGILADDMGLGKTIQIITILQEEKNNTKKAHKPSLVVCPSSLCLNWKNEVEKFGEEISTLVITGNVGEREEQIKQSQNYDLVITSYDLLKRDLDIYLEKDIKFRYQIADEAQYIKNSNTQNARSLKEIKADTRFALTGTPIENSLAELWSIFDYIMPNYLFNYNRFKREFEIKIVKDKDERQMERLKAMIEPFILRRTKKQVLTELPEKIVSVIKNEMSEEQQKAYLTHLAQTKNEVAKAVGLNGIKKSQIQILALLTRLRQICCHPSLFLENYEGESSKLNQCIELIKEAIAGGHKILLFSTYSEMLKIIEKELEKENIQYFKLTGQTKTDQRVDMVNEFNQNEEIKVFLISLKAGGTGLNLTGADIVIHYDPWWNVSVENQATDRAYRIGQKNKVQVYKLITKNSIEEKIDNLQQKKAALIDEVLDTQTTFVSKLTEDEILELFN